MIRVGQPGKHMFLPFPLTMSYAITWSMIRYWPLSLLADRLILFVGDAGVVEISDILFTTQGPTPGVVLVEWNAQDSSPGSAGMWGEFSVVCRLLEKRS